LAAFATAVTCAHDGDAFPYVVNKGDTVGQIAERLYGRIELERVVVAANLLDDVRASVVIPGMRLEIPAVGHHRVVRGDSWASIAAAFLGGVERADVLSRLNGDNPWVQPDVGREIIVPYNLRYVATVGDTTDSLAYRFLGKRDHAWLIQSYNALGLPELGQGQVVLVPLTELALTEHGRALAAQGWAMTKSEAGGAARSSQEAALRELATLERHVRGGAYIEAIVVAAGLVAKGDLTVAQSASIHALLTESYAAVGAKSLASHACAAWRAHDPKLELDPLRYSPKILTACLEKGEGASPEAAPATTGAR
jgi:phage tail protein X